MLSKAAQVWSPSVTVYIFCRILVAFGNVGRYTVAFVLGKYYTYCYELLIVRLHTFETWVPMTYCIVMLTLSLGLISISITMNPFCLHGLTLITAWICYPMPSKMWGEITYPFLNFNCVSIEIYDWISNFVPHLIINIATNPSMGSKLNHIGKRGPRSGGLCMRGCWTCYQFWGS